MRPLHRTPALTLPALGAIGFAVGGWTAWLVLVETFVLVPLCEVFLRGSARNPDAAEEARLRADRRYTPLLWATGLAHLALFGAFLVLLARGAWSGHALLGNVIAMGISCGVLGINLGHELGHRRDRASRAFARLLLWTSAYAHFQIEHNRGHHARVGTPGDPASARLGESMPRFFLRALVGVARGAWRLEAQRLRARGRSPWSVSNQALRLFLAQIATWLLFLVWAGPTALCWLLLAQLIGILNLETVNYVEHYGLARRQRPDGRYEPVGPQHSWNSDHPLGRALLFDLTRHSDHHANARRPYQVLRHPDGAPSLPIGYPAAVLLAWVPPLWFRVMNPRVAAVRDAARSPRTTSRPASA